MASFWIDATEVSVDAYRACVRKGACRIPNLDARCNWPMKGEHPMNCVSWGEAQAYCTALGKRPPLEKEWELAARGTDGRAFPWGDDARLEDQACPARGTLGGEPRSDPLDEWFHTCPVGTTPVDTSPFGVKDLSGNVEEYALDIDCPTYDPFLRSLQVFPARRPRSHHVRSWARTTSRFSRAASGAPSRRAADVTARTPNRVPWIAALTVAVACGGPAAESPSLLEATARHACFAGPGILRQLIVDWPAADRGQLWTLEPGRGPSSSTPRDAVWTFSTECRVGAEAMARTSRTERKRQIETASNAQDLFGKLPLAAASLSAKLSHGRSIHAALDVVGTWQASRDRFARPELTGDCALATHVVTAITVGAFELAVTEGQHAEGVVGVSGVGGAGVAAGAGLVTERLASDGDERACTLSTSRDAHPPDGCGALLRLTLAPLSAEMDVATSCPPGTRWDGAACAARVDLACPPGTHLAPAGGCLVDPLEAARDGSQIAIPAGVATIGSTYPTNEAPVHAITVAAFRIDATEVTVEAYKRCVDGGRCTPAGTGGTCTYPFRRKHPVNCVDFGQAEAYCRFVGARLPTEEEWEYAARGTKPHEYPWGDDAPYTFGPDPTGEKLCWKRMDPHSPDFVGACPVASFPYDVSPFGLLDMGANVSEWTSSPYCAYADPRCASRERVIRGGFWSTSTASALRVSARSHALPNDSSDRVGFRCARDAT